MFGAFSFDAGQVKDSVFEPARIHVAKERQHNAKLLLWVELAEFGGEEVVHTA